MLPTLHPEYHLMIQHPLEAFSEWFASQLTEDVQLDIASLLLLSIPGTGIRNKDFTESGPEDLLKDWLKTNASRKPRQVIGAALSLRASVDFLFMSQRDTPQRWQALSKFTDNMVLPRAFLTEANWLAAKAAWSLLREGAFSDANFDRWSAAQPAT